MELEYQIASDEDLLEAMGADDINSFNELYKRYWKALYLYSCRICNDQADAEDIVQDVFAVFWQRRSKHKISQNLSTYLLSAVKYKFLDLLKKNKVRTNYLDVLQSFIDLYDDQTEHYIMKKDLEMRISQEISQLPDKMRLIFQMSRQKGLSNQEIAKELDISEKTVRNQLYNALKILRPRLEIILLIALSLK